MKVKKNKEISIQGILKGNFLVKKDAARHWKFIVFFMLLAFISITSSHMVDNKIHKITLLRQEISELHSEYTNLHKDFMQMRLESKIQKMVAARGLFPLKEPPYELKMD